MSSKYDFSGNTIAVTGAGKGIGRATVLSLHKANADKVFAITRTQSDLDSLIRETNSDGRIVPVCVDLSNQDYMPVLESLFKNNQINMLVNNAGTGGLQNFEEIEKEIFEEIENSEDLEDMENFEEIFEDVEDIENFEEIFEEIENSGDIEDIENFEDLWEEMENSEDIPEYIDEEIDDDFEEIEAEFEEMLESFFGECLDGWNEVDGECFILGEKPLRSLDEADLHCKEMNELAEVVDFMPLDEFEEDEKFDFLCSYPLMDLEEDSEAIIDDDLIPFTDDETDCKVETPFNGVYQRSDERTESGAPVFVEENFGYQAFVKDGLWVFENPDDEYLSSMISLTISESETQPKTNENWVLVMPEFGSENEIEGLPIDGCSLSEDCITFTVGGCGSIDNE